MQVNSDVGVSKATRSGYGFCRASRVPGRLEGSLSGANIRLLKRYIGKSQFFPTILDLVVQAVTHVCNIAITAPSYPQIQ